MKIREILKETTPHISFEVFPPKTDAAYESVLNATDKIAALHPSYISVTYGAGGGTSVNTVNIAAHIRDDLGVESLAHLTCVSSTREHVHKVIGELKEKGIENILALRGDIPQESDFPLPNQYRYACELIEEIKGAGDFCIGAACYPEGHVESENRKEDVLHLKEKVDRGVDFLTTQMFFDNSILYNFLYRIREAGVTVPVLPGSLAGERLAAIILVRLHKRHGLFLGNNIDVIIRNQLAQLVGIVDSHPTDSCFVGCQTVIIGSDGDDREHIAFGEQIPLIQIVRCRYSLPVDIHDVGVQVERQFIIHVTTNSRWDSHRQALLQPRGRIELQFHLRSSRTDLK